MHVHDKAAGPGNERTFSAVFWAFVTNIAYLSSRFPVIDFIVLKNSGAHGLRDYETKPKVTSQRLHDIPVRQNADVDIYLHHVI